MRVQRCGFFFIYCGSPPRVVKVAIATDDCFFFVYYSVMRTPHFLFLLSILQNWQTIKNRNSNQSFMHSAGDHCWCWYRKKMSMTQLNLELSPSVRMKHSISMHQINMSKIYFLFYFVNHIFFPCRRETSIDVNIRYNELDDNLLIFRWGA